MSLFKRRRFPVAIILLCVRWSCKYGISYRDLAEMMSERGVSVNPSTIFRWVQRYAPELEKGPAASGDPDPGHGAWMRPMYEVADAGGTCFERSISTVSSSTPCCPIGVIPERRIASCAKP